MFAGQTVLRFHAPARAPVDDTEVRSPDAPGREVFADGHPGRGALAPAQGELPRHLLARALHAEGC